MHNHETPYGREELKQQLQELEQKISAMEAEGTTGPELDNLHAQHEHLQSHLNETSEDKMDLAA